MTLADSWPLLYPLLLADGDRDRTDDELDCDSVDGEVNADHETCSDGFANGSCECTDDIDGQSAHVQRNLH